MNGCYYNCKVSLPLVHLYNSWDIVPLLLREGVTLEKRKCILRYFFKTELDIILEITIMTRSSRKGKGSEGKGERNCLDWTQNTRNTDWVIKWVIVRIAAYFCASLSQILRFGFLRLSTIKKCPHMPAEKQQRKVSVVGGGGGGGGMKLLPRQSWFDWGFLIKTFYLFYFNFFKSRPCQLNKLCAENNKLCPWIPGTDMSWL